MKAGCHLKTELIDLLCRKSFQYSDEAVFKLVSGRRSRYYVNCKPTTLHPRGMFLVGHLVYETIGNIDAAGVGGMTFGADPIALATAFVSEMKNNPLKAFSIRKSKKDHGIAKWVEGDLNPGDRVVIIDDVATTGGSTVQAIERARSAELNVVKAVILVDRQEGGMDNIRKVVPDAVAVITREELTQAYTDNS